MRLASGFFLGKSFAVLRRCGGARKRAPRTLSALCEACIEGDEQQAGELLQQGAQVDHAAPDGWTPLHAACGAGHEARVRAVAAGARCGGGPGGTAWSVR